MVFNSDGAFPGREFFQFAILVDDLDSSMAQWVAKGVGPFFVARHMPLDGASYRGTDVSPDVSLALAQAGGIQIELVVQHNDVRSAYRDSDVLRFGPHHMAMLVDDYDAVTAAYAGQGIETIMTILNNGVRVSYLDTRKDLGLLLEVVEATKWIDEMYAPITEASIGWDGSDPVRPLV